MNNGAHEMRQAEAELEEELKHKRMVVDHRKAPYDVYIGRPSPFGNPFRTGRHVTREMAIQWFEEWVRGQPELVARIKRELRGKVLGCWCESGPCHGHVLVRIANEES